MTMTVLGTLKTLLSPLGVGKDAAAPAGGDGSVDFAALLGGTGESALPQGLGLAVAAAPVAALGMPAQLGAATKADLPSTNLAAALGLSLKSPEAEAGATEPATELPVALPGMIQAAKAEKPVRMPLAATEQFSQEISKKVHSSDTEVPEISDLNSPEAETASVEASPLPLPTPDAPAIPSAMGPIVATAQAVPAGAPLGTAANEPSLSASAIDRPHPLVASASARPVAYSVRPAQIPVGIGNTESLPIAEDAAPAEGQTPASPSLFSARAATAAQPVAVAPAGAAVPTPVMGQPTTVADMPMAAPTAIAAATPITPATTAPTASVASVANVVPAVSKPRVGEQAAVAAAVADTIVEAPEVPARTMRQLRESIQAQPGEATALLRMLSEAIGGKAAPAQVAKDVPVAAAVVQATAAPVVASIPRHASANVAAQPERKDGEAMSVDVAQAATDIAPHAADRPLHVVDPSVTAIRAQQPAQSVQAQPVDLAASLGQQVIDMSSGSQWIDGLAREIATLSKGDGQGSFRLSPEHLGPMRVDIRNGDQGAQVTLTVETETAQNMLQQDSGRLKADAQLSSVRIADVVVERVHHIAEPSRADSSMNQGNGGQQPQHQASAQAGFAQGQGQSQQNTQSNNKTSGGQAVLNHAEPQDRTVEDDGQGGSRRARYA